MQDTGRDRRSIAACTVDCDAPVAWDFRNALRQMIERQVDASVDVFGSPLARSADIHDQGWLCAVQLLGNDQDTPRQRLPPFAGAGVVMQGEMQLGAVVLQGRHEANRDAHQDRDAIHGAVQGSGFDANEIGSRLALGCCVIREILGAAVGIGERTPLAERVFKEHAARGQAEGWVHG